MLLGVFKDGTCTGLLEDRNHVLQERGELVGTLDAGVLGRNVLMVPKGPSFSENGTVTFICLELALSACPYLTLFRLDTHGRDST